MLESSWLGRRVSLRRVLDRDPDGRPVFGDVVGDLIRFEPAGDGPDPAAGAERAVLETRDGLVSVELARVVTARRAVPATADELNLEAVVAAGWRPAESADLGGWRLRATGGFTGRANSVLPLRPPGVALDEALDQARAWYAERGLPLRFQLPVEARRLLDAELGERGWAAVGPDVHVLAARLDLVREPARSGVTVRLDPAPDAAWLAGYRDGAAAAHPEALGLLTRHDRVVFAAVRAGEEVLAIGRGTVDDGWLGITAVEVAPSARRRGLARAIMAGLWAWGRTQGATRTHLEVSADNAPALALYAELGYWAHHDYRYRHDPEQDAPGGSAAG